MTMYSGSELYKKLSDIERSVERLILPFERLEELVGVFCLEKDMPGKAGSGMDELGGLGMFGGVSGLGSGAEERVARGTEAAVTGGTRSTTVNINLGKMVENIVFNGTLGENAQELETKIQEILTRTLMMAAATA